MAAWRAKKIAAAQLGRIWCWLMAGGQLNIAHEVMVELGLEDVPLVGIAKGPDRDAGREHFFMHGKSDFTMPPNSPVLYYLQRLRDEAHRFAIGGHRARRSADIRKSARCH